MSFGFGFALPAYPLRGGGGNNPFNQSGPTLDLSFMGNAGNLSGADTYTLDTNFITPQYQVAAQYAVWVDGSGMTQRNFADIVTFSRGSNATQFDSSGNLVYAPNNAIRNNMMVGAVAGTPGTLPTNWASATSGLTRTIVGTGTSNGVAYIDVRFAGTSTNTFAGVYFETSNGVAAANGQTWTPSAWVSVVGGSTANITSAWLQVDQYSNVSAYLSSLAGTNVVSLLSSTPTRYSVALITNNASTAFIVPSFSLFFANGAAIDITLRIGMPQLELGSTATAVNATSGTAYYGPRFDFNPSTLAAQGLLIEEQRTNSIRNNTMQGAVAGTPGTLPTNWTVPGAVAGITWTVVGTGVENGITYIDIKAAGTPGASTDVFIASPETTTGVAALNGQTWTSSMYVKLQGGSLSGINVVQLRLSERDSGGANLVDGRTNIVPTASSLSTQRFSFSRTNTNASTAFIFPSLLVTVTSGVAIDITLRIGLPQLEQGAFATSVIPTTTTALTRSADVASVNTLSPWYNQTNGTVYAEFAPAFQGSATAAGNNPGVWGATQNSLGSFNGYGVRLFAQSAFSDNINGVSRYSPSGFNTQVNIGPNAFLNLGQTYKTAFAWEASGIAGSRDGQAVVTNTNPAAAAMGTHDQFYLGRQNIGGTPTQLNGWLRRVVFYPRRLANADLQTITT